MKNILISLILQFLHISYVPGLFGRDSWSLPFAALTSLRVGVSCRNTVRMSPSVRGIRKVNVRKEQIVEIRTDN